MCYITVTYSNERLRTIVEEYITKQKSEFTLQGICSYVLYWAIEDGKTKQQSKTLFNGSAVKDSDQQHINHILDSIVKGGRLIKEADHYQLTN